VLAYAAGCETIYSFQGQESAVTLHIHLVPVVSIAAGVLILVMPRLLNYIVAIYLILIGIVGLGLIPASAL